MFTITSTNQPQDLLSFDELSEQWQTEARDRYDYFDDTKGYKPFIIKDYFVYQDRLYNLCQFTKLPGRYMMPGENWDKIYRESTTGGVLIRRIEGRRGQIVCGHYSSH